MPRTPLSEILADAFERAYANSHTHDQLMTAMIAIGFAGFRRQHGEAAAAELLEAMYDEVGWLGR